MDRVGFVQTMTAQEVTDNENKINADAIAEKNAASETTLVTNLSQYLSTRWEHSKEAKKYIEEAMMDSCLQRKGQYNATKLQEIKDAEQPEIFMNITDTKCRNAVAWIKDIIFQPAQRIFSIDTTPIPELPQQELQKIQMEVLQQNIQAAVMTIQQTGVQPDSNMIRDAIIQQSDAIKEQVKKEINKLSKKMALEIEDKIDDDFVEGGFYIALEEVIDDIISLKAGIIKGIIFRKEKVKKTNIDANGKITRTLSEKIIPQYERRSPFCIYPSPRSTGVDNGYLFDVITLRPKQLYDMIGVEGYNEKEIRNVLKEFNSGTLKNDWLGLSQDAKDGMGVDNAEDNKSQYPEETIYALEFWGEVPGNLLNEWGLKVEDEDNEYSSCVWKIGNHIIKAMFNYDLLGKKPYSKTSFQNKNDSFWGEDIPEKIADCQQVCNACSRSVLSNVGMGALPQIELNLDRLAPGESRKLIPGKVWGVTEEQIASGGKAMNFFQPVMVTEKLMNVYSVFSKIADEHSGVPAYAHGDSQVGGAGNTASGLNMLITQAARGIKAVIRNIDIDIIIPCLERHYEYLLDTQEIFGLMADYKCVSKGTSALLAKEQLATRKIEFMANTANPIDVGIIGEKNRRKMLFEVAKSFGIELSEDDVPPPQPPQQALPPGAAPPENPTAVDQAGNPAQGTDVRQFNQGAPPPQMMAEGGVLEPGDVGYVGEEGIERVENVDGNTVVTPLAGTISSRTIKPKPGWNDTNLTPITPAQEANLEVARNKDLVYTVRPEPVRANTVRDNYSDITPDDITEYASQVNGLAGYKNKMAHIRELKSRKGNMK